MGSGLCGVLRVVGGGDNGGREACKSARDRSASSTRPASAAQEEDEDESKTTATGRRVLRVDFPCLYAAHTHSHPCRDACRGGQPVLISASQQHATTPRNAQVSLQRNGRVKYTRNSTAMLMQGKDMIQEVRVGNIANSAMIHSSRRTMQERATNRQMEAPRPRRNKPTSQSAMLLQTGLVGLHTIHSITDSMH